MSIHKSKGLEFPIVILSNTAKAFNFQDSKENILMDSELGFGLKHLEEDVRYETLPFVAIKNKLVQETISEELRVLYVALTRAKEKLLITGVVKDLEKTAKSWALAANREGKNILPLALKKSPSYLKWIGIGLFALDGFEKLRDLTGEEVGYTFKGHSKWEMKIYPQDTTAQETLQTETAHEMPYDPKADWDIHQTYSTYKEAIDKQLNYTYPYQYAVTLPTKIAVSALKNQEDFANLPNPFVKPEANSKPSLPQFMNPDVAGLSATDKGTLIHSLFEQVDFLTCTTSLEIQTRLNELAKQGKIDPLALKIVDIAKLAAFAQSPMLSRMQKAAAVYKEKQFVCLVSAQLVNPDCDPKEEILMQGVIDTFFIEPEGIVVIDYKTDYVDLKNQEASVAKIQQRYANQLHLYGEALSKILQKPVKEKWLYLYQANRWVEV
jgi:ATP-dependent helicase/nuclease subunit A